VPSNAWRTPRNARNNEERVQLLIMAKTLQRFALERERKAGTSLEAESGFAADSDKAALGPSVPHNAPDGASCAKDV
jgi:hypothetical protein